MDESQYLPNYGVSQGYRVSQQPKDNYADEHEHEVEEDEEQKQGDAVDTDEEDENHTRNDSFRHPKKRKLKSLLSSFQFAPPQTQSAQRTVNASTSKSSFGGRNTLTDWSEHETFVLLEAWGERFLQRGRKSVRSEEWQEVAEKVSQESKIERTDTQCRNRLDTLKKKYKKEKPLLHTKWVYFKKMDMLMSATPQRAAGLSCGVDSGEYVFMNPSDSPGNTDSREGDDDSDLLPLKLKGNGGLFKLLADSINKFSERYKKIEDGKRKQMVELENMKMDFYKELELQKRQILDRARDEIVKIRKGDYEENHSASG